MILGSDVHSDFHCFLRIGFDHPLEHFGIGHRKRSRRNLGHSIGIAQPSGMGKARGIRARRADKHRFSPQFCRLGGRAGANSSHRGIARTVLGALHLLKDKDDFAFHGFLVEAG